MEWIIVERGEASARRLEAVRLADGETRCLIAGATGAPYGAALDPTGRWLAARVEVDGEPRCALVDLEAAAVRAVAQSLDAAWQLEPIEFDDAGRRLLATGRHGAAAASDVYVVEIDPDALVDAEGQRLVAGAHNPERMGLWAPRFAPGGGSVFYLQRGAGDLYTVVVLDVDTPGDSMPSGRAPSRRTLALTEPMRIAPEAGLVFCPARKQLYFAHLLAGKQRLARKPLTGQPPRSWWRAHPEIRSIDADPAGAGVAYVADGQVLWADLELDDVLVLSDGPATGPVRCAPDGWVLYLSGTGEATELRAIHRPSRSEQTVWTGPADAFTIAPPTATARLAALPTGPLPAYVPDADALARREAEETARREAEEAARKAAEDAARQAAEDAARRAAEEAERRAEEERRAAEEALRAKAAALAAAAVQADAEAEEAAARQAAEEAARREAQEAAAREAAEAAAAREAEEAAAREAAEAARKAEATRRAEATRKAEAARRAEAARKAAAARDAAAARKAAEEAAAQQAAEEVARQAAEDAARKAAEDAAARQAADAAAARKAAERPPVDEATRREAARLAMEAVARRRAERMAQRRAEDAAATPAPTAPDDAARRAAADAARKAADDAARREVEETARRAAADAARREAEEVARKAAEDAARREAEETARKAAEETARNAAEDAARRAADDAARRAAPEPSPPDAPLTPSALGPLVPPARPSAAARFTADALAALHLVGVVLGRGEWSLGAPLFVLATLWTIIAATQHARRRVDGLARITAALGAVWWVYAAATGALAALDFGGAILAAGVMAALHVIAPFVIRRR